MNVAVLGASAKPERYSYQAVKLLRETGHAVYPVHPSLREIDGLPVFAALNRLPVVPDVVTLYVSAAHQDPVADDLLALAPRRVIFSAPGTRVMVLYWSFVCVPEAFWMTTAVTT